MRYSILILAFILSAAMSFVSAQKIVDEQFAEAIREQCPACIDKGDKLTKSADTLKVLSTIGFAVKSWEGFNFPNLTHFYIQNTQHKFFPFPELPTTLEELYLLGYGISSLPNNLPRSLKEITCNVCNLGSLSKKLPNTIETLNLKNCQVTSLPDTLPTNLKYLNLYKNKLKTLPKQLPKGLTYLNVSNNQIHTFAE